MTLDLCQSVRLYADHRPKDVPGSNAGLTLAAIDHLCATGQCLEHRLTHVGPRAENGPCSANVGFSSKGRTGAM